MTTLRRKRRITAVVFVLLFALVLVGAPLYIVDRAWRREQATHELAVAVSRNDTRAAVQALRNGADPNTRQRPTDKPPTLAQYVRQFSRQMRGEKVVALSVPNPPPPMIVVAAEEDATSIVERLLAFGADPDAPSYYPDWHRQGTYLKTRAIDSAVSNNNIQMAQTLIQRHTNVNGSKNEDGAPILTIHSPEMLSLLVRSGANVHAQVTPPSMVEGMTPIHLAARSDDVKSLAVLLAHCVSVNDTYDGNGTPLMAAAYSGATNAMRFLLEQGADVNAKSAGSTALINACSQGDAKTARFLLAHGADVELREQDGESPLIAAIDSTAHTHETAAPIVKTLIEQGANVNAHLANRDAPLRVAIGNKDAQTVALLRAAGAKR